MFSRALSGRRRSSRAARPVRSRVELCYVITAGVLWGTGGLSGTLLGQATGLHPLAIATYRLAGGGLSLLAALAVAGLLRRAAGPRPLGPGLPRDSVLGHSVLRGSVLRGSVLRGSMLRRSVLGGPAGRRVLAVGALAALYQAAYFGAIARTDLGVATLVTLGSAPVMLLAVESVAHRRRPGAASLLAIALALAGLGLLVGFGGHSARGPLAGTLLALLAAAGFGAMTLLGRYPVAGLDGARTIGFGFTVGAVLLAAVSLPTVGLGFAVTPGSVGLLLYLGWLPTALAYVLFFRGLRGVSASSAAVVAVLEPVTATVLGALVLGERLGWTGALGAGLLCLAALAAGLSASDTA